MTISIPHNFAFDPTYGFDRSSLQTIEPPAPVEGFEAFWRARFKAAMAVDPRPSIRRGQGAAGGHVIHDVKIRSTAGASIRGWLMLPKDRPPRRALVIGHGYGGRTGPDFGVPVEDAALLFPCFRGLSRSARPPISTDPQWHVLHDIHNRDDYVIGRCVDDLWLSVSALLQLFPWLDGHIGYAGVSLGGGIGALALPWDTRIARAHLSLPTFGHQPIRLHCPSVGSAAAVQRYAASHPQVLETLAYFDAAVAAQYVDQPVLVSAALFDPSVPPPGQFAVHNGLKEKRSLFILDAGHFSYDGAAVQEKALQTRVADFFRDL